MSSLDSPGATTPIDLSMMTADTPARLSPRHATLGFASFRFETLSSGVNAGEFARLVPRDTVAATAATSMVAREGGNTSSSTAEPGIISEEDGGDIGAGKRGDGDREGGLSTPTAAAAAATVRGGAGRSARGEQQQKQLLAELVPPAGNPSLPGAGIPFVVAAENADGAGALGGCERGGDRGDGGDRVSGPGRDMSAFERQALQKARARQRERMEEGEPQVRKGGQTDPSFFCFLVYNPFPPCSQNAPFYYLYVANKVLVIAKYYRIFCSTG